MTHSKKALEEFASILETVQAMAKLKKETNQVTLARVILRGAARDFYEALNEPGERLQGEILEIAAAYFVGACKKESNG